MTVVCVQLYSLYVCEQNETPCFILRQPVHNGSVLGHIVLAATSKNAAHIRRVKMKEKKDHHSLRAHNSDALQLAAQGFLNPFFFSTRPTLLATADHDPVARLTDSTHPNVGHQPAQHRLCQTQQHRAAALWRPHRPSRHSLLRTPPHPLSHRQHVGMRRVRRVE